MRKSERTKLTSDELKECAAAYEREFGSFFLPTYVPEQAAWIKAFEWMKTKSGARIAELEAEVARLKETIEAYKDRDRDEWGEAVWVDGE